jgi:hydroxyacylglutathione hydrolase
MQFIQLPAFNDNYLWLLEESGHVWAVDPGDANVVQAYLEKNDLSLDGILITHHHQDHIGGVIQLRDWALQFHGEAIPIYGPSLEDIPFKTQAFKGGEVFNLMGGASFQVIDVGGHTKGHIAYFLENSNPPRLFCGDTLFANGCGRIFEGTANQLFESLQRLVNLPKETLVCCAHEYTLSNIKFAKQVEPNNSALLAWSDKADKIRELGNFTVPTTIAQELAVNPFLRCHEKSVIGSATDYAGRDLGGPAEVFAVIRAWKDVFK